MVHVVALFFGVAAVALIIGGRVAPRLFPPPDWMKRNFDMLHSSRADEALPILERISRLASGREREEFCHSQRHRWAISQSGTIVFDCLGGFGLPPEESLTTIPLENPGLTLSLAKPFRGRNFFPERNPGKEPPPAESLLGLEGPPPPPEAESTTTPPKPHATPAIFRLKSGESVITLLMPRTEPHAMPPLSDRPTLFLAGVALALLLALLAIVHRMLAPLPEIEAALEEYSRGNFRFRPKARGPRELRRLGMVMGQMAEELERLVENKNRLLIDVSHELKTPLARLRVHTALAKDDPEAIDDIEKDVIAMASLVERILDNARAAHSQGRIENRRVNLASLVKDICERSQERARAQGTELTLASPGHQETWTTSGDERQLHAAIENVVDNALKYCSPTSGKVMVSLAESENELQVRICNDGQAIPEAHQKLVFEPFYRVDDSRTRSTGGHGLGLSIAQRIAVAHGGRLELECSNGEGTTFVFSFPRMS